MHAVLTVKFDFFRWFLLFEIERSLRVLFFLIWIVVLANFEKFKLFLWFKLKILFKEYSGIFFRFPFLFIRTDRRIRSFNLIRLVLILIRKNKWKQRKQQLNSIIFIFVLNNGDHWRNWLSKFSIQKTRSNKQPNTSRSLFENWDEYSAIEVERRKAKETRDLNDYIEWYANLIIWLTTLRVREREKE